MAVWILVAVALPALAAAAGDAPQVPDSPCPT